MNLENNAFLITGGASGLGAATAEYLVSKGAKVVLADLNEALGAEMVAKLGAANAVFSRCDVTSPADVQTAIDMALSQFGNLRGAINCAGIASVQKVLDRDLKPADLESFSRTININLVGSYNVARLTAAAMAKQDAATDNERGVIINTASIAAFDGQIGQAGYSASKGGVVGMMLPLAREFARHGIRVLTVAPGVFATPMMQTVPEPARLQLEASVPFPKRLGHPAEYGSLIAHMLENTYLNGEVVRVDGGIRMI